MMMPFLFYRIPQIAAIGSGDGGGGGPGGPTFANVKLVTSFDGVDAATSATDDSNSGHALTFVGNAQIDTAQKKFGTASLLCDGTGDYVTAPGSTDWDFGTGDYTLEFFVNFSVKKDTGLLCRSVGTQTRWAIFMLGSTGRMQFYHSNSLIYQSTTDITTLTWPHIAFCRASGTARVFVNGVMESSVTTAHDILAGGANALHIGTDPASASARSLNGWMDEVRITKGEAVYASDSSFTPPSAAFPRS